MKVKSRSLFFVVKDDPMIGTFLQFIRKEGNVLEFITMPDTITLFTITENDFERGVLEGKYDYVQRIKKAMFSVCEAEYKRLKEIENAKYQ
jgi:hypothetical protein